MNPKPLEQEAEVLLVKRILAGEAELFEELIRPHLPRIKSIARLKLRNEADAEDATQQAVIKAFSHLASFRHDSSFYTWLSRITLNEIYQLYRSNKRLSVLVDSEFENGEQRLEKLCSDPSPSPLETLERNELAALMSRLVLKLPEHLRSVLLLRHVDGLAINDIAVRLRMTQSGVKTRLHRARRKLASASKLEQWLPHRMDPLRTLATP